jgi:geranylgeranyl diphosphate synthase type II
MHKTAALLKVAVASGAILGGANDDDVRNCEVYAEKIGLAFQSELFYFPRYFPVL